MKQRVTLITRNAEEIAAVVSDWRSPGPEIVILPDGATCRVFVARGERHTLFGGTEYRYYQTSAVSLAEREP